MAYELKWNVSGQVIDLVLYNHLSVDEMKAINQDILALLEHANQKVALVIDSSELSTGYNTVDHLRTTQQYMHRQDIDSSLLVANSKLNRLISLLAFNPSRVPLFQFEQPINAHQHLVERAFFESSSDPR